MTLITRRRFAIGAIAPALAGATWAQTDGAGTLDPAARFAELVRTEYVDVVRAEALASLVERRNRSGAYASAAPEALAAALMSAVEETTRDKHFLVMFGMHGESAPSIRPGRRSREPDSRWLERMRSDSFGVRSAAVDANGVGVIDLRRFHTDCGETREALGRAMAAVRDAKALVFDMTKNIGGDPATVAYLCSHLIEGPPIVINRFHWRSSGTEEFRTSVDLSGPRFPMDRPVWIAVSANTFSAAEEFAYNLQALRRARVVGARTAGGAHHAEGFSIGRGIIAFIPCARAENPITGGNWEGVGVAPDVSAPSAEALARAIALAAEA